MSMDIVYCGEIHDEEGCTERRGHKGKHSWETAFVQMKKLDAYIKESRGSDDGKQWKAFKRGFDACRGVLNLEEEIQYR